MHPQSKPINCRRALIFLLFSIVVSKQTTEAFASENKQQSQGGRRQPWDLFRFVQQSSKFVTMPSAPPLPFVKQTTITTTQTVTPGDSIWTPSPPKSPLFSFAPLDDVVMGGVSSSAFDNNSGMWSGFVSEDNSGGFVGIRSTPFRKDVRLDMSQCSGIELRLKGSNGRRIKAIVRDSSDFNGICWTSGFDMPAASGSGNGGDFFTSLFGEKDPDKESKSGSSGVTVIRVPFQEMIPTVFANVLNDKPKGGLNKENIMGIQLTYSKFEYNGELNTKFTVGDFDLQILDVRAY